jgi:hypothetical protein
MLDPDMLEARNEIHNMMCPHIVRVQHRTSADAYGKVTYGPETEYGARVEKRLRIIPVGGAAGQTKTSEGRIVFAAPFPIIDVKDRIQIPVPEGGYKAIGGIVMISQDPTGAGTRPTVIYF